MTPLLLVNYQFEVPHSSLVCNVCKQIRFIHDKPVVNSLPISQSHHAKGCELLAHFHHNSQLSGNNKLGILALTSDSNVRWALYGGP